MKHDDNNYTCCQEKSNTIRYEYEQNTLIANSIFYF